MNRTFIITLHFKGAGAFEVYVSGAARAKKDKTLQRAMQRISSGSSFIVL